MVFVWLIRGKSKQFFFTEGKSKQFFFTEGKSKKKITKKKIGNDIYYRCKDLLTFNISYFTFQDNHNTIQFYHYKLIDKLYIIIDN